MAARINNAYGLSARKKNLKIGDVERLDSEGRNMRGLGGRTPKRTPNAMPEMYPNDFLAGLSG